jgi:hypothetical protein
MHKYVFTDTNLFEQFQPIENIDWLLLAGCDSVTLVIPAVTLSELNKHKDGATRGRIKRRAANTLSQLSKYARKETSPILRPGVNLIFRHQEPLIDFAAYHLSKDMPDDRLLASGIEFACERNIRDGSVMIATGDLGLELKTKAQSLVLPLPLSHNLRLPDEPDAEENRIKELEAEVKKLRSSAPELSLSFRNGANHEEFALEPPLELKQEVVQDKLAQLRCKYPLREQLPSTMYAALVGGPEAIVEYNTALGIYYSKVEQHYTDMLHYLNRQRLSFEIGLSLFNTGGAPADDIDVEVHLPDGLTAVGEEDIEEEPKEPQPPCPPEDRLAQMFRLVPDFTMPDFDLSSVRPILPAANTRLKGIKKTNSYLVSFSVNRLKHTVTEPLPAILARFDSDEAVRSFTIDYRILAGNVSVPFTGELHAVVSVT